MENIYRFWKIIDRKWKISDGFGKLSTGKVCNPEDYENYRQEKFIIREIMKIIGRKSS